MRLVFPVTPVSQSRPIFARTKGKRRGIAFDPPKSREFKATLTRLALQQYQGPPIKGALTVDVVFYRQIPPSWSKKKRDQADRGDLLPLVKPDIDNYYKALTDGLNGLIYEDDKLIVRATIEKRYSYEPRIEASFTPVGKG